MSFFVYRRLLDPPSRMDPRSPGARPDPRLPGYVHTHATCTHAAASRLKSGPKGVSLPQTDTKSSLTLHLTLLYTSKEPLFREARDPTQSTMVAVYSQVFRESRAAVPVPPGAVPGRQSHGRPFQVRHLPVGGRRTTYVVRVDF